MVLALGLGVGAALAATGYVIATYPRGNAAPSYCPFYTGSGMQLPTPGDTGNTSPNATIYENGSVIFTAQASGCVPPYSFDWEFGDGTSSTAQNLVHVYPGPGFYPGSLTIRDSAGHQVISYFCVDASGWPNLGGSSGSSPPACPAPLP